MRRTSESKPQPHVKLSDVLSNLFVQGSPTRCEYFLRYHVLRSLDSVWQGSVYRRSSLAAGGRWMYLGASARMQINVFDSNLAQPLINWQAVETTVEGNYELFIKFDNPEVGYYGMTR